MVLLTHQINLNGISSMKGFVDKVEGTLSLDSDCDSCDHFLNDMSGNTWTYYINVASVVILAASLLLHLNSWNSLNTSIQNSNISLQKLGSVILGAISTTYKNISGASATVHANAVK